MANIFIHELGVPRKYRNGRIYGGNSFNTTNPYEVSNVIAKQRHFESGRIEYETGDSKNITVPFKESFDTLPILCEFKVYRLVFLETGKYVIQDVLHYFASDEFYDVDGFSVVIDAAEDINGVILNYNFTE